MSMQPPGNDPHPDRSFLAQLLMNLFNKGQPWGQGGDMSGGSAGGAGTGSGFNMFPAAPGSGLEQYGLFPEAPGGPPTDMTQAGMWGAGRPGPVPDTAPTPSPRPRRPGEPLRPDRTVKAGPR